VPKGSRNVGGLDEIINSLCAGGMTLRDIGYHLQRTYGTELSRETISKITDSVLEEVAEWQRRPLEEIYPIIYLDALVVKVRDDHQVRNRAAHIAVGVDLDGIKHVLGIWVQAAEGAKFWAGVCAELANRGVRDVLIVCCDGLTGFPEAIEATWPRATVQTCVLHLIGAAMRYVSYADRKKVVAALRPVYTAPTVEAGDPRHRTQESPSPRQGEGPRRYRSQGTRQARRGPGRHRLEASLRSARDRLPRPARLTGKTKKSDRERELLTHKEGRELRNETAIKRTRPHRHRPARGRDALYRRPDSGPSANTSGHSSDALRGPSAADRQPMTCAAYDTKASLSGSRAQPALPRHRQRPPQSPVSHPNSPPAFTRRARRLTHI
jgi:hypothetical protein